MAPLFPAILLCGPPHSGKSILFYRLSQALREQHISHYGLRASPDGEGDWTHEADPQLVRQLRMRSKTDWTPAFAQQLSGEIERRLLPLLVDTGGQITPETAQIAASCTHGIIISRDPQAIGAWRDLLTEQGCIVLAELHSQLDGAQQITQPVMPLRGTLTGLHPEQDSRGGCFSALLALIVDHMDYAPDELFRAHERAAARDWVVHLGQPLLPSQSPDTPVHWNPHDIPELLASISHVSRLLCMGVRRSGCMPRWRTSLSLCRSCSRRHGAGWSHHRWFLKPHPRCLHCTGSSSALPPSTMRSGCNSTSLPRILIMIRLCR